MVQFCQTEPLQNPSVWRAALAYHRGTMPRHPPSFGDANQAWIQVGGKGIWFRVDFHVDLVKWALHEEVKSTTGGEEVGSACIDVLLV